MCQYEDGNENVCCKRNILVIVDIMWFQRILFVSSFVQSFHHKIPSLNVSQTLHTVGTTSACSAYTVKHFWFVWQKQQKVDTFKNVLTYFPNKKKTTDVNWQICKYIYSVRQNWSVHVLNLTNSLKLKWTAWFDIHPRMVCLFLSPYSPFLNPIEEFFSAWRWRGYDHHPHAQFALLDAMNVACQEILPDVCQGWVRHAKRFFPWCRQGRHPLWCWWGKLQFFFLYTRIFLFLLCIQAAMFCFVFYCRLQHFQDK